MGSSTPQGRAALAIIVRHVVAFLAV